MRLKPRDRRRLAVLLGVVYVAVLAWVISPLFGSPTPERIVSPKVGGIARGSAVGGPPPVRAEVPARLPGSSAPVAEATESVGEETGATTETEITESTAESSPPVESAGSDQGSSAGGGGSEGKTVIGFEG